MAEQRENLLGGRQFSAMTGSAPISPELRAWVEDFLDIHLINGYGSTEDGVVLVDGAAPAPTGARLQAGRRPGARLLRHRPPASPRRIVGQVNGSHPRLLQAARRDRRTLRRRRLVPHRRRDGRDRTRPAELRRPPQQRAQAVAGRVRHRLQAGGGLRRPPVDPADLRLRQQRPLLRAGRDRADRRRAGRRRRRRRRGQAGAGRRAAERRARGRPAVLRDPARLPRRDHGLSRWRTDCSPASASWPARSSRSTTAPSSSSSTSTSPTARPTCCATLRARRRQPARARDGRPRGRRAARRRLHRRGARRAVHRPRWRLVVGVDLCQSAARHLRGRRAGRRDRQPGQRPGGHRRLRRGAARRRHQAAHLRRRPRPRRHRGARPRPDAGQVPRRGHPGGRAVAARPEPARSAPCC